MKNLLGYNITTIGNHEFNNGPEIHAAHFEQLSMPIVCANINTTLNPLLGSYIKPYHIFEEYSLAVIVDTNSIIEGPYPTIVKNAEGEDTLIVQAFWSGKYVGHLDISFNKVGKLVAYSGEPILIDQSITQDLGLANLVSQRRSPFDKYTKIIIGNAIDAFDQMSDRRMYNWELDRGPVNLVLSTNISSKSKANSSILNNIKLLPYPDLGLITFDTENKILTSYILEQKNIIPYLDGRIQDIAILNK
ncbi:Metallo-dependent phosphatase-like protein [Gigaspora rosea]|uniref:Metallo-dependent phosphatase-like protein n=1 Tax=Gigaspora rosea TaxID=44941 RepID=A0A397UDH5_9GLOM|nr:Metallo-dependent phosphatase-like protein [Gigaspora rosea]